MTHNHTHSGPTLPTLSPEALAALKLPVRSNTIEVITADNFVVMAVYSPTLSWSSRAEIAAFIAAALNELLTPAAPAPVAPTDKYRTIHAWRGRRLCNIKLHFDSDFDMTESEVHDGDTAALLRIASEHHYTVCLHCLDILNSNRAAALAPAAPAPTSAETDAALLEDAVNGRR